MRRRWKWIIGAVLLVIIGAGAYLKIYYNNLENYTFNEGTQLLTNSKGVDYRNLQEHFMEYTAINTGKKIGKYGQISSVYEIVGQENHDWILDDNGAEMGIQEVRIKKGLEAIPLEKLKPQKVEIIPNKGFQNSMGSTKNAEVIHDIMATLLDGKEKFLKSEKGVMNSLWVEDPRMKGIAYVQYVLITEDNQHVYLAEVNKNLWHEVNGPSKKWLLDTLK